MAIARNCLSLQKKFSIRWRALAAAPLLVEHPVIGVDAVLARGPFPPVEKLRRRVELVVVAAVREDRELVQIVAEPRRLLRHENEAVLDRRRLHVHAHDLVGLRAVAGDGGDARRRQFLDSVASPRRGPRRERHREDPSREGPGAEPS